MTDCITWPGRLTSEGYVAIWKDGRPQLAHRLLYEQHVGPIPAGLTIDHLCSNRACLNWRHYEVVSLGENGLRGSGPAAMNARKTACASGHPFDEENTFYYRSTHGGTGRGCRICRRDASLKWRTKQRGGQ